MSDTLAAFRRTVDKLRDGEPLRLTVGHVPEVTGIDLTPGYEAALRQTLIDALEAELLPPGPEPAAAALQAERIA